MELRKTYIDLLLSDGGKVITSRILKMSKEEVKK